MPSILMLTHEFPPSFGGIGTYTARLADAAVRRGHAVTVAAPDYGRDLAADDRDRYPFRVERFRSGRYSERSLPATLLRAWRLTGERRFEVVHAADWPHTLALGLIDRARRTPFVTTIHGTEVLGSARSRLTGLLRCRRVYETPGRVLAVSEFTRDLLFEHFPRVDPARVVVTPLGVAPFWFSEADGGGALRAAHGIPADSRIVLTASRLDRRKGHPAALRALAQLYPGMRAGLTYVVVGTGDDPAYERELRELAAGSGVRVVFTGSVDDVTLRRFYAEASLFLMPGEPHPKKVEGFGLVFLEAAAQGIPSVTSDVGAVAEVVRDGQTGLVVPPRDGGALAGALARLLADEPLRAALGRAARAAAEMYTWDRCAALTYDGLPNRTQAPRPGPRRAAGARPAGAAPLTGGH